MHLYTLILPASGIKVNDIVIGRAVKFKSYFDNQEARVVAVFACHYKVEMLTGEATGKEHRYLHAMVSLKESAIYPVSSREAAVTAPSTEATGAIAW